jgi:hypothetical protein
MKGRILFGLAFCAALAAAALLEGLASGASSTSLASAPWKKEFVPIYDDDSVGQHVSMAPDGSGGAAIAYQTTTTPGVVVTHWEPGGSTDLWNLPPLSPANPATYNSIALYRPGDGTTKVVTVYYDSDGYDLYYSIRRYNAQWSTLSSESGYIDEGSAGAQRGLYPSVAFDSTGVAHVAYYKNSPMGTDDALWYARYVGSGGNCGYDDDLEDYRWECEEVHGGDSLGRYASLAIDGSDNPHIAYYDGGTGGPFVASHNGVSWAPRNVWRASLDTGPHISLAVGDGGDLHVAYYNATSATLEYATWLGVNGGGNCGLNTSSSKYEWQCNEIEAVGTFDSGVVRPIDIGLDGDGRPVIAYQDAGGSEELLKVARPMLAYVGGSLPVANCGPAPVVLPTWYCETVSSGEAWLSETGSAVALGVNSAGLATLVYRQHSDLSGEDYLRVAYQRARVYLPLVLRNAP